MAGPNQQYTEELLGLLGFVIGGAGKPGAGDQYPITKEVVAKIVLMIGKSVHVEDSGHTEIV